jgi:hypothetical protein
MQLAMTAGCRKKSNQLAISPSLVPPESIVILEHKPKMPKASVVDVPKFPKVRYSIETALSAFRAE